MAFLIGDIIDAVMTHGVSLRTIRDVEFKLSDDGNPSFHIGGSTVVFRVIFEGRLCAMRCYLRSKPYLREIYGEAYYPAAVTIYNGRESRSFDIVMCDWMEGEVLSQMVRRGVETRDSTLLRQLSSSFNRLSKMMLNRHDWAHGDLSGRNIIVDTKLEMHLIDHDSAFVASLAGERSIELGTPAYQSPLRDESLFSATMDDFSIALIAVSLRALSIDPTLALRHPFEDGLLLNGAMTLDRRYAPLKEVVELLAKSGEFATYRMACALSRYELHIEALPSLIDFQVELDGGGMAECGEVELYERMGVWGFCAIDGDDTTPPLYDEAFEYRNEEALVRVVRWWFYINRSGVVVTSCGEWIDGKPPIVRQR